MRQSVNPLRENRAGGGSRSSSSRRGGALILLLAAVALSLLFSSAASAQQQVVDKMVATVNGGVRTDLITYSDLLWQLALQPGTPLSNPRPEDLNSALQSLINQRLISQEAERLPGVAPTDDEVKAAIAELVKQFPSSAEFEQRLRLVGFSSINDEQFEEIIRKRLIIEKYLNFRFRSFTVVTPQEEADYYARDFVPRFRRQNPGRIVPTLEEKRAEINHTLTENKIESDTDAFLDSARENAEIVILSPVS